MSTVGTGIKNKPKNNTGLMDSYIQKEPTYTSSTNKRLNNVLSPPEEEKLKAKKKMIKHQDPEKVILTIPEKIEKPKGGNKLTKSVDGKKHTERIIEETPHEMDAQEHHNLESNIDVTGSLDTPQSESKNTTNAEPLTDLRKVIENLVEEMRSLKNTVHHDISGLQTTVSRQKGDITKLEESVTSTTQDLRNLFVEKLEKINDNEQKIKNLIDENKLIRRDNVKLKERLVKLEKQQLDNNVLITGQPEEAWESYERTKQIVLDTMTTALKPTVNEIELRPMSNTVITSCRRLGRYKMGRARPISVTFHRKEDKQKLLENKRNLPPGIYVNDEYPLEIKVNRDTLRPILRLAKSLPNYRDKSKIIDDRLVINGITYTVHNLHQLPIELAPYKAAQKVDETTIGFSGELSPWSNLHKSPFELNGQSFDTAEHWIQYTKSKLFGDTTTSELILNSENAREAKKLGYKIQGYEPATWHEKGYELCFPGIKAKFHQNPNLLEMLKTTTPKVLVESTLDKTWGTGVPLNQPDPLNPNKWHNQGWLSSMLMDIRDNP